MPDLPAWLAPAAPPAAEGRLVRPLHRPEDDIDDAARERRGRGTEKLLEYNRKRAEDAFARDGLTPDEREKKPLQDKRKSDAEKKRNRRAGRPELGNNPPLGGADRAP